MAKTLSILCANGVNLDLLGQREANIYGNFDLAALEKELRKLLPDVVKLSGGKEIKLEFMQSNDESEFFEKLSASTADGFMINAGAWTHTSLALADRLRAISKPFVEVHISNISAREEFRKHSFTAPHAAGVTYGFGMDSYVVALVGLARALQNPKQKPKA
jgi:3-dehydroquinate dehydratase-2